MLAGDSRSRRTIKTILSAHERVTVSYINKNDEGIHYNSKPRLNSRTKFAKLCYYALFFIPIIGTTA